MRRDGLAGHIAVAARTQRTLDKAIELGLADSTTLEPASAAKGADLVMVCAPPGTYDEIGRAMAPALAPGCIVSDVGSVKRVALRDLAPHLPDGIHLVPGHPVAGTEHHRPGGRIRRTLRGALVHFDAAGRRRPRRR